MPRFNAKRPRFITSHPTLVVCSAERATALCGCVENIPLISGLISISDPPPYAEKRPPPDVMNSLVRSHVSVSYMNFRDLLNESDTSGAHEEVLDPERTARFADANSSVAVRVNDTTSTSTSFKFENVPNPLHVERILKWSRAVLGSNLHALRRKQIGQEPRIIVHCTAGRSRSSAAAFIILCDQLGPGHEEEAMRQLLTACERTPLPNTLLVNHADKILERNGAMLRVAEKQNDEPQDCEADSNKPVTGTALLAGIRKGIL